MTDDRYRSWAHGRIDKAALPFAAKRGLKDVFDTWVGVPEMAENSAVIDAALAELRVVLSGYDATAHDTADAGVTWVQARNGALRVGDTVRVKPDAFTGAHGAFHNGRICRVVGMRYGDIIVRDDTDVAYEGIHHQATHLLKQVKTGASK